MPRHTILLAGPPQSGDLSTNNEDDLLCSFIPAFEQAINRRFPSSPPNSTANAPLLPTWRLIPSNNEGKATTSTPTGHEAGDAHFLEHSFAAVEDIATALYDSFSHDNSADSLTTFISNTGASFISASAGTSFDSFSISPTDLTSAHDSAKHVELIFRLKRVSVTDLGALPSPRRLLALYPQTVTPTLLAGVVSISPPRSVTVRPKRAGEIERTMDIIELLLADETASGFGVTFWLVPDSARLGIEANAQRRNVAEAAILRAQLSRIRRGDVVLLIHVALSTYKGEVFGQSLSRRGGCVSTGVVVIPPDLDATQMPKLAKVRNWVASFVGDGIERRGKRNDTKPSFGLEELPHDTQ